jgi:hypothetical protein
MESIPTPSIADFEKWDEEQVIAHLRETVLGFKEKHAEILRNNEINGSAFLEFNKEELRTIGLAAGPATNIAKEIERLKKAQESKPALMTSSVQGKLAFFCVAPLNDTSGPNLSPSLLHSQPRKRFIQGHAEQRRFRQHHFSVVFRQGR